MTAAPDLHPGDLDRRRQPVGIVIGAIVVVLVAGFPAVGIGLDRPDTVARVSVHNPSTWEVRVRARTSGTGPWLDLGQVERESTVTWIDVLDEGPRWEVSYESRGRTVDTVVAREAVVGTRALEVPSELLDGLVRDGEIPATCPAGRVCGAPA